MVQIRENGSWEDIQRVAAKNGTYSVTVGKNAAHSKLKGSPGQSLSIRLQWKASAKVPRDWATSTKSVTFAKTTAKVSAKYPYGTSSSFTVGSKTPKTYKFTADPNTKYLRVQRYDAAAKKWITSRNLSTTGVKSGKAQFTVPLSDFGYGAKHKFRLYAPEQASVKEWTGATQTVSWPKSKSTLSANVFNGLTVISSTGGQKAEGFVSGMVGRQMQLQQYVNKKWVTKSTMKTDKNGKVTVNLPKLKHNTSAKFRLHAPTTAKNVAATGKTISVKYQDPRKVTGLAKEVRDLMKSKCPTATVTLVPNTGKQQGWAASANGRENRISINQKMNRNRSDWKPFIKYVAQHECAHILTYQASQKAGANAQKDLNKLFKTKDNVGVERMADAMAYAWSGNSKYGYYTKKFTTAQVKAAKKVLAGKWF